MKRQKSSHIFTKIVFKPLRTNLFHIVLSSCFLLGSYSNLYSQELQKKNLNISAKKMSDTLSINQKSKTDSTVLAKNDTVKKSKNLLENIVHRTAKDYESLNQKKKEMTLYNQAHITYTDVDLTAGKIVINYDKDEIYAGRIKDSLGNLTQRPVFKQGNSVIEPDSIRFNTKTKKALVWNTRTTQQDFKIKADISKRVNDSVYYMKNARFTTSEDIDNPEYYFLARKIKFVPGKKVVVGFTNMVIADVPTPIALPFAYFPMTDKAVSGFIIPSFGDTNQQGYYLQNGGYYFALSDHYDLTVLGDYYTNGSYAMRFESSYAQRYKFKGHFNVRFENQIFSERGFPDYTKSNNYNIQWNHTQDAKANPYSTFSASVNLGSSKYFRQSLNQANLGANLNNTMNSSVTYNRRFQTVPEINFAIAATHMQNTNTEQISMTLPSLQLNVDRVYPFASKNESKRGMIKNLNLQYTFRGENRINTTDKLFFTSEMFDGAKTGAQHSIPISTNFKVFKHFSVSAGGTLNEYWYLNSIEKSYDAQQNAVVTKDLKGFERYNTYNFSASVGTTIYGTFNFGDDSKIQAIRHTIRPNISYSYTPSFDKYYDTYAMDASGTNYGDYTKFEGGMFGTPSRSYSNTMGINIGNSFEAKVRDKDEAKTEAKKVMLLNSLNFQTTYNFAADSLALSPIRISGGTSLFDNKLDLNFGTTLDPYAIDNGGRRIDKWNMDNGGSLFRMTSANLTLNYALNSKDFSGSGSDKAIQQNVDNGGRGDDLFGRAVDMADQRKSLFDKEGSEDENESELYKLVIPWDLRFAYSLTYGNNNRENKIINNSLMVSGNVDITPMWKVGMSSGYDFANKGVTYTQLRFERDLKSWRMSLNWVPIGAYTSWGFFIGIKSSALSDIKWEKRSLPNRSLR